MAANETTTDLWRRVFTAEREKIAFASTPANPPFYFEKCCRKLTVLCHAVPVSSFGFDVNEAADQPATVTWVYPARSGVPNPNP